MKHMYRLVLLLACLMGSTAGVAGAQGHAQGTPRCWDCNGLLGCFLLPPGGGPGWSDCTFANDVCILEGNCPLTVAGEVDASGTVMSADRSMSSKGSSVVQASTSGRVGEAMTPGSTWRVSCKGDVLTRSMGAAYGLALRRQLREIRL